MALDFCTYENRIEDLVGLKLLVLSLAKAMPDARLHIPTGGMPSESLDWLASRPNVDLHDFSPDGDFWHVKPSVMGTLIAAGLGPLVWLDADIIVTRDLTGLLSGDAPEAVIVAEEPFRTQPLSPARISEGLGLMRVRDLGFPVNSSVVRVSERHVPLVSAWAAAVRDWQEAIQALGIGDQEVLAALLESAPFAALCVRRMRSGQDIVHCWLPVDYSLWERLSTLWRGEPALVHAQQAKPWRPQGPGTRLPGERQLYRLVARALAPALDQDETPWLAAPPSGTTRALQVMLGDRLSLYGLVHGAEGTLRRTYGHLKRLVAGRYR